MTQAVLAVPPELPRLRTRLAWLAMIWLLIVGTGGAWLYHQQTQHDRVNELKRLSQRLGIVQDAIGTHFQTLASLTRVLAQQPTYADFLVDPAVRQSGPVAPGQEAQTRQMLLSRPAVTRMNRHLQGLVADFQVRQVALQDPYGNGLADSADRAPGTSVGTNLQARQYFRQALESGVGFQFLVSPLNDQPLFHFTARIDRQGLPVGVLVLKTGPQVMQRFFQDSSGRSLFMTDERGVIVAGNQPAWVLHQLPAGPDLSERPQEVATRYRHPPPVLGWSLHTGRVGPYSPTLLEVNGRAHMALSVTVPGYPYTVWAVMSMRDERALLIQAWALAGVALLIGWLLMWSYWRRRERRAAVERARGETLAMTRSLPLTLFRYRIGLDGQGQFTYVGPGIESLFGRPTSELLTDVEALWRMARPDLHHPPTEPVEFEVEAGGQRRWISLHSTVAHNPDGSQIYDGYWLDITSRKQAETYFEAAFEHAQTAFIFFHREHGILRCNPAALKMFAADSFARLQGLRPWMPPLSPPTQPDGRNSQERAQALLDLADSDTQRPNFEWQMRRLNGQLLDTEIRMLRLSHEGQDLYFAALDDVSARKATEAALKDAHDTAEAAA
ncbi:MAG TPA: PAS domain S-box protein, partial [Aquabacterium sp.]|nr:PAS domain S-box protein [Aquabacterium sp.]